MTYTITAGLTAFQCDACGATFGVPFTFHSRWRQGDIEKARLIYCCCCGQKWNCGETEVAKLNRQLAAERAQHDQTRADRERWKSEEAQRSRQLAATRGVVTRTKRRIYHGVCPCCKRTFQNLRDHMHHQHPDYTNGDDSK